MHTIQGMSQIFILIAVVALIWLTVRAFRRSALWGLGVLFLSPIVSTFYGIKYWDEDKKPFLIYTAAYFIGLTLILYVFASWGGFRAIGAAKQVHDGIMQQNLSEQDTREFMNANLDFLEKAVATEEERQKIAVMRKMMSQMQDGVTEKEQNEMGLEILKLAEDSAKTEAEREQIKRLRQNMESTTPTPTPQPNATSEPEASREANGHPLRREDIPADKIIRLSKRPSGQTRYRVEFRPIELSDAADYLYKTVIITNAHDKTQKATLIGVQPDKLIFEQRFTGGSVTFEYPQNRIKTLKAAHQVSY